MPLGTLDRSPPPFFKQGPSALSKLMVCSALALFLMVADARFRIHESHHLGMEHGIVERHHEVHAQADEFAGVELEDGCAERAAAALDVLPRKPNTQPHAVLARGEVLAVLGNVGGPGG